MRYARLGLIIPLVLLANLVTQSRGPAPAAPAVGANGLPVIQAPARAAGFTYGPSVSAADRLAIETALAGARPEARRLVEIVDGLTQIDVGAADGAAGQAGRFGDRYLVLLDLHEVQRMGPRAVSRLVLHELAHVVDFALLDDATLAQLDTTIPEGWVCERGRVGSCAVKEERFAETFAKWATGDIGVDIYLGYKVPPPKVPLDTWGAPLSALGT